MATSKGWIANRRDHGKICFIDLRHSINGARGIMQCVFDKATLGDICKVPLESVISVEGDLVQVGSDLDLKYELKAHSFTVISLRTEELPFQITGDNQPTDKHLRLKHRFLDIRREKMRNNLEKRSNVLRRLRNIMECNGFMEVQTPILTAPTPEGARDFLVPSRLHPDHYYALPQSPQQFKQLLMIGGIERYYQIAPCFRNEDARADRAVGEFYQLDFEMAFVEQQDIMSVVEKLIKAIFPLQVCDMEFPVLTYKESIAKYGTDKPDLRGEEKACFKFVWITDFPMFDKDGSFAHNPFSKQKEDGNAWQFDLVCNGVELGSGGLRNTDPEAMEKAFAQAGTDITQFDALHRAFKLGGVPPHGGFALGIERMLMLLLGKEDIADVIAFPLNTNGIDPLMNAPRKITPGIDN